MAHSLTTIGRHLECAIQAEMGAELMLALIERKQSCQWRSEGGGGRGARLPGASLGGGAGPASVP